jgi:hypothetical protein
VEEQSFGQAKFVGMEVKEAKYTEAVAQSSAREGLTARRVVVEFPSA